MRRAATIASCSRTTRVHSLPPQPHRPQPSAATGVLGSHEAAHPLLSQLRIHVPAAGAEPSRERTRGARAAMSGARLPDVRVRQSERLGRAVTWLLGSLLA